MRRWLITAAIGLAASTAGAQTPDLLLMQGRPGWVLPGATVDFNFAGGRYYQAAMNCPAALACISTSRASTGTASDSAGNWLTFASNQPRITNQGLLVEESRTNGIRNNTMQGAAAGSPGTLPTDWSQEGSLSGLTQTIVGTGTQNGIAYIDYQLSGTTTSDGGLTLRLEQPAVIAAASGQTWTCSLFLAVSGGSMAGITQLDTIIQETTSGGGFVQNDGCGDYTGGVNATFTRYATSATLSGASTGSIYWFFNPNWNSGSAINVTFRIGWPQLEQGAFATSPIPTSGAAATRAADVVTVTKPPPIGAAVTLYESGTPEAPTSYGTSQTNLEIDDGSLNNRLTVYRRLSSGDAAGFVERSGSITTIDSGVAWAQGAFGKLAMSSTATAQAVAFNGGSPTTGSATAPSGLTTVLIGSEAGGLQQTNGTIARVALWPTTALPAAQLQYITSGGAP